MDRVFCFGARDDEGGHSYIGKGTDEDSFVVGVTSLALVRASIEFASPSSFTLFHADDTFNLSDLGYPVITCGFLDASRSYQLSAIFVQVTLFDSATCTNTKALFKTFLYQQPRATQKLLQGITNACVMFLLAQQRAGAQALQPFESVGVATKFQRSNDTGAATCYHTAASGASQQVAAAGMNSAVFIIQFIIIINNNACTTTPTPARSSKPVHASASRLDNPEDLHPVNQQHQRH
ncbi:hypothetical protein ON010_g4741 [Phytophthora cinnamomi]|nr:hypothetical protein ON010_g4741 [Phytophthora cinnamomi]